MVSFESKDDVRFWKDVEIMLRKNGSAASTDLGKPDNFFNIFSNYNT